MSRGKKSALLGVGVPAVLAASSFFLLTPTEPTYQGQPVDYWLDATAKTLRPKLPSRAWEPFCSVYLPGCEAQLRRHEPLTIKAWR